MNEKKLVSRVREILKEVGGIGSETKKPVTNPIPVLALPILSASAYALKKAIADPRNNITGWENPSCITPWAYELSRHIWPLPDGEPGPGHRGLRHEAVSSQMPDGIADWVSFLHQVTRGVIVVSRSSGWGGYYPRELADGMRTLEAEQRKKAINSLLNPDPLSFPFSVQMGPNSARYREVSGSFEITFLPLIIIEEQRLFYYPVRTRIMFSGSTPKNWPSEAKAKFWKALGEELDREISVPDLPLFTEVLSGVVSVDVTVMATVPIGAQEAYRSWVESLARQEAARLWEPSTTPSRDGIRCRSTTMPVLTAQQEKDYCKHDYLRYESIWIPGGTPINQANRVEISGRWVTIGDAGLGLLLRLVVELKRCKGGWVKIGDLVDEGVINAGGKYQALNRLRKAFQRGLPEGVAKQLIQRSGSKEYRLSTHPSFATYSRAKLVEHPDKTVRAQARKLPRSRRPKR